MGDGITEFSENPNPEETLFYCYAPCYHGCITSLLIAIQDFLVSGVRFQVSANSFLTPDT